MATPLPSYRSSIGGWTIERYQQLLGWPILVIAIAFLFAAASALSMSIIAGLQLIVMIGYGVRLSHRRAGLKPVAVTGALVGLMLGAATGAGSWVANRSLLWGLNLVTQAAVTTIAAMAVTTAVVIFIRRQNP